MESIKITFLESFADGLRRLTTDSWKGACLVMTRKHFESAQKTTELIRPGVYILVGASHVDETGHQPKLISKVYIGKSDVLDERLRQHHESKDFWSTAFAFYRPEDDLHAGQLAQLEAHLIEKAMAAGNHVLQNVQTPRKAGKGFEPESLAAFVLHVESMLKALGHDFFSVQSLPQVPARENPDRFQHNVPENLKTVVEQLEAWCRELPMTEFYGTAVPDLRAKVMHEGSSRVFARIEFQKRAVKLTTKGGPRKNGGTRMLIDAQSAVPAQVRLELQMSHDQALKYLAE